MLTLFMPTDLVTPTRRRQRDKKNQKQFENMEEIIYTKLLLFEKKTNQFESFG